MWQKAKNWYHLATAFVFNALYGFPGRKLTIIGVTGTSGKTTTTHMIYEILRESGHKVSMLSTIEAVIGGAQLDTGFHVTTPDPHRLPKYLAQALKNGDTHFVLEISSHALDQNRAAFLKFKVGVLTTLAHEHLDYHKTFENYARAKFKLLQNSDVPIVPVGVLNTVNKLVHLKNKIVTFGLNSGDFCQTDWELRVGMPGEFNVQNGLAAAAACSQLDISKADIKKALKIVADIPGRYEEIKTDKNFRIIIDFAHKPDALEGLLNSVQGERGKGKGRIITMFGSAAQRDLLKRPMMGEIAGRLSDITVLTDEDPRFESSEKIINEIAAGCEKAGAREVVSSNSKVKSKGHIYYKIPDRREAITFILQKLVKKGDVVLLCGKGHERSINYRGVETPWSEQGVVEDILNEKN